MQQPRSQSPQRTNFVCCTRTTCPKIRFVSSCSGVTMPHILYSYHVHVSKPLEIYNKAWCVYWSRYHNQPEDRLLVMDYAMAFVQNHGGELIGPVDMDGSHLSLIHISEPTRLL